MVPQFWGDEDEWHLDRIFLPRGGIAWYLSFEGMRMNAILIEYSFPGAVLSHMSPNQTLGLSEISHFVSILPPNQTHLWKWFLSLFHSKDFHFV
jgi:hypothetical protein